MRSVSAATKRSWMPSVTIRRDDAVQRWPVEKKAPLTRSFDRDRRGRRRRARPAGSCRPSRAGTCACARRDAAATRLPVPTEPVKVMASTSGLSSIAWPTTEPVPMTRLSTPFGRPARLQDVDERPGAAGHEVGRLEDDGVAVGERRRDLPGRDGDREVPRRDDADDADRLARDLDADARAHRRQRSRRPGAAPRRRRTRRSARRGSPRRCLRPASCPPRAPAARRARPCAPGSRRAAFFRMSWRSQDARARPGRKSRLGRGDGALGVVLDAGAA